VTIDQSNHILSGLAELENDVALIYMHRGQLNQAETHCKRCLTYSRLFKGTEDEEANLLFEAFYTFSELRQDEGNFADALILAEEAYNCVAVAYNPVHPQVQKAAGNLIECLTLKGDFNKAELFAQMTLDSLKDPGNGFDQQSEAVAFGYLDLAKAISAQKGDYVKAEKLARESLRIRDLISSNSDLVGHTAGLLALMLVSQGKLGSETKELFEQCLAIGIREFGPEGPTIPNKHLHLGSYYRHLAEKEQNTETRKEYLRLSESMIKEALRIHTKLCGLDDPRTFQFLSELSIITHMLSQC
jgi:tetratricopeptide (TPR) repeat protein